VQISQDEGRWSLKKISLCMKSVVRHPDLPGVTSRPAGCDIQLASLDGRASKTKCIRYSEAVWPPCGVILTAALSARNDIKFHFKWQNVVFMCKMCCFAVSSNSQAAAFFPEPQRMNVDEAFNVDMLLSKDTIL